MTSEEWETIKHFSINEVLKAGGDPFTMDFIFMKKLDRLRTILGRPIKLVYNGLNSGHHKAVMHKKGKAADWYLRTEDGPIDVLTILYAVLSSGLRGFGVYWNGTLLSFHTDSRKKLAFWKAVKESGKRWTYTKFLETAGFLN